MGTHTYAILEISSAAFSEINMLLTAAGYTHAFHLDEGRMVIDMHGIALADRDAGAFASDDQETDARAGGDDDPVGMGGDDTAVAS